MNSAKIKLREIYIPFLIVSLGTVILYCLFRWIFDIKLGLLPLQEDILDFWIPILLPWFSVLVWLRKRIRILQLKGKGGDWYFGYQCAMVAAIATPLVVSQELVDKISYDLIEVSSVSEIHNLSGQKYFKVNSFDIEPGSSLSDVTVNTSGKYDGNLNFNLFFATPFRESPSVWYGVEYKRTINNNSSDQTKNLEYSRFLNRSKREFKNYNYYSVKYFEKLAHSKERAGFLNAVNKEFSEINGEGLIFLIPKVETFKENNSNSLNNTIKALFVGSLVVLVMLIFPKIDDKELRNFKKNKPVADDDFKDFLEFINPKGDYKGGAVLIILNLGVFIVMVIYGLDFVSPSAKQLLEIGGNRKQEVLGGEYWRLLTSTFIHNGAFHLVQNLIGLTFSVVFLERVIGHFKFILVYVISGICASIVSMYWNDNMVSVGASGAIFGLFGVILAFAVFKIFSDYMRKFVWIFLALTTGSSLLYSMIKLVDNAAHIGGLISGFVLGAIFVFANKEQLIIKEKKEF